LTSFALFASATFGLGVSARSWAKHIGGIPDARVWYNGGMSSQVFFDVDPATLRLPNERIDGADPAKLQRQIARHGRSLTGMPPVLVYRGADEELMLSDGVTRATRAAKLCPGSLIPAELLGTLPRPVGHLPTVKEKLP
jgi:hypothetical protein